MIVNCPYCFPILMQVRTDGRHCPNCGYAQLDWGDTYIELPSNHHESVEEVKV